ncbi:hypothetical protein CBM2633_B10380 [Cupriavidus taiwanensis]|nr:hypothetical protein CBM2604_B130002 [Cupriavidus taiwanensis]SOZ31043.1 hypothetical protein CBM2609_B120002 [Cupriavidus taiwanensis]SOZ47120.1 hypothetical protein CBM2610_B100002 [Cupriavidus taiwanensis]SPA18128.1 hypothetical protein CBM2633_B10380 [Cupriavidus taiwanensis]
MHPVPSVFPSPLRGGGEKTGGTEAAMSIS